MAHVQQECIMNRVSFVVEGIPIAQPRLAQSWKGGRRVAYVARTSKGAEHPVKAFKQTCALRCKEVLSRPLEGAIGFRVVFVLPRPLRLKRGPRQWCPVKPDAHDNLMKSWSDAVKGIAWKDDCQLVKGSFEKVYAASGEEPHTEVEIWEEKGVVE